MSKMTVLMVEVDQRCKEDKICEDNLLDELENRILDNTGMWTWYYLLLFTLS